MFRMRGVPRKVALLAVAMGALGVLWGCNLSVSEDGVVAVIQASPTEGRSPLEVTFDGSGSRDPAGAISEYLWDFGDGSEVASGVRVTHLYSRPGSYLVTLVVTGPSGVGRATTWIHVDNTPPQADFTFWPQDPVIREEVGFDASPSTDPDGEIVAYYWDFGDGATAEGQMVSHTYKEAAEYVVTLRVVDDSGAESQVSKVVSVSCGGGTCPLE